ncbi:DUF2637 domain-containing protein [Nonomuraea sp. NPDC005983]|uniref:DUF2637 domain-containing protein n=1 Tax=Nonomuraea sp. NPDC005983 TaxID=3155595 RepID=UPI00339EB275
MDVTPPSLLRRLGIALAGLAVAALTGAACALSFDGLRALAIRGEARTDLAYLYPAAFDALLAVALIGVLLLGSARLLVRLQAAVVLVLLIVAAAVVNVTTTLRVDIPVRPASVGVAVAPWVMLALALWLWLLVIKQVQARRTATVEDVEATAEPDIVPFHRVQTAEVPRPRPIHPAEAAPLDTAPSLPPTGHPTLEATPVTAPTPASETPPISERVTRWPAPAAPDPDPAQAPEPDEEPGPLRDPEPHEAPEPFQATEPRETAEPREAASPLQEAEQDPEPAQDPEGAQHPEPEPEEQPKPRPVRWGDRVKPTDVLVHPRVTDKDADTQPHPVIIDDAVPAPEPADEEQPRASKDDDTAPHRRPFGDAPSGRLRSTPVPPED